MTTNAWDYEIKKIDAAVTLAVEAVSNHSFVSASERAASLQKAFTVGYEAICEAVPRWEETSLTP